MSSVTKFAGLAWWDIWDCGAWQKFLALSRSVPAWNPMLSWSHLKESNCLFGTVGPLVLKVLKKSLMETESGVFLFNLLPQKTLPIL